MALIFRSMVALGDAEAAAAEAAALAVLEALGLAHVAAVGRAHAGAPEPVAPGLARPGLSHHHLIPICTRAKTVHLSSDQNQIYSGIRRGGHGGDLVTCLWPRGAAARGGARPGGACGKPPLIGSLLLLVFRNKVFLKGVVCE